MFCSNCGNQLPDDSKFCSSCGFKIEPAVSQNTSQSAQQYIAQPEVETIPAIDHYAPQEKTAQNSNIQKEQPKKKKLDAGARTGVCFSVLFAVITIVGVIIAANNPVGNIILLLAGLIEIAIGAILYKIVDTRMKFTCPECGTKRIQKRIWLQTDEKYTSTSSGRYEKITYTHIYHDSFTCPKCNNTFEQNVKINGGYISNDVELGRVEDHRLPVREIL